MTDHDSSFDWRTCAHSPCGREFVAVPRVDKRYCSERCRQNASAMRHNRKHAAAYRALLAAVEENQIDIAHARLMAARRLTVEKPSAKEKPDGIIT